MPAFGELQRPLVQGRDTPLPDDGRQGMLDAFKHRCDRLCHRLRRLSARRPIGHTCQKGGNRVTRVMSHRGSTGVGELALGWVLHEPGQVPSHVYFPTTAVVSLLYLTESGVGGDRSGRQ